MLMHHTGSVYCDLFTQLGLDLWLSRDDSRLTVSAEKLAFSLINLPKHLVIIVCSSVVHTCQTRHWAKSGKQYKLDEERRTGVGCPKTEKHTHLHLHPHTLRSLLNLYYSSASLPAGIRVIERRHRTTPPCTLSVHVIMQDRRSKQRRGRVWTI